MYKQLELELPPKPGQPIHPNKPQNTDTAQRTLLLPLEKGANLNAGWGADLQLTHPSSAARASSSPSSPKPAVTAGLGGGSKKRPSSLVFASAC